MDQPTERRLVLAVAVHEYATRTARMAALLKEGLPRVLDDAAARAGLDRAAWDRLPTGDGEVAVLPASEPEPRVADRFIRELYAGLRDHNRTVAADARLRLVLAIHFGPANTRATGFGGRTLTQVQRLRDGAVARRALDLSGADLVVVFSAPVFDDTIAEQLTPLEPRELRKVEAGSLVAWLWAPGHPLDGLDLDEPAERAAPAGESANAGERAAGSAERSGPTTFPGATIHATYVSGRDMTVNHGGPNERDRETPA